MQLRYMSFAVIYLRRGRVPARCAPAGCSRKKGRAIQPCLSIINRLCVSLLLELSPDSCQPNQTEAKKKHGGWFGDCGPNLAKMT